MTETGRPRHPLVVALLVVCGIVALVPGLCGAVFYGVVVDEFRQWAVLPDSGNLPASDVFIGVVSASSILLSLLVFGLIARAARGAWRYRASLIIAVLAMLVPLGMTAMLLIVPNTTSEERNLILVWAVASLLVVALPPWLLSRSRSGEEPQQ